jgi:hypothetical protein
MAFAGLLVMHASLGGETAACNLLICSNALNVLPDKLKSSIQVFLKTQS